MLETVQRHREGYSTCFKNLSLNSVHVSAVNEIIFALTELTSGAKTKKTHPRPYLIILIPSVRFCVEFRIMKPIKLSCCRDNCFAKHWYYLLTWLCYCQYHVFTARCTLVQSAVLRSHVVCLSVCLSVTLVNCDHIGWNSSKIISPLVSLGRSLFATPTWRVCSKGNTPKFSPE